MSFSRFRDERRQPCVGGDNNDQTCVACLGRRRLGSIILSVATQVIPNTSSSNSYDSLLLCLPSFLPILPRALFGTQSMGSLRGQPRTHRTGAEEWVVMLRSHRVKRKAVGRTLREEEYTTSRWKMVCPDTRLHAATSKLRLHERPPAAVNRCEPCLARRGEISRDNPSGDDQANGALFCTLIHAPE